MEPIHARAVDHLEIIVITRSWHDGITWMPIHHFRDSQSVPVDDGRIGQFILQPNLDSLTLPYPENGTQIRTAQRLDGFPVSFLDRSLIPPNGRFRPRENGEHGASSRQ